MNVLEPSETRLALSLEATATLDISYRLDVVNRIFDERNTALADEHRGSCPGQVRAVVVDDVLADEIGTRAHEYYAAHGIEARVLALASGEARKDMDSVLAVVEFLDSVGVRRSNNAVVAIGGNVLLDVVGFAASMYRRGIPWIRIPTTLLGVVDGCVSAKTGVNHRGARNRLGSFHPAARTFIDSALLATLPRRQISNACGEILKMALIKDARLFELLEQHGAALVETSFQHPSANEVIERSIIGMHTELRDNLWERDLKRIVDYGHIFSPPIEMAVVPELLHGEAVAIDCLFTAAIAEARGLLRAGDVERVHGVIAQVGLPSCHPLFCEMSMLHQAIEESKLHRGGDLNLPILHGIGVCGFTQTVDEGELAFAVNRIQQLGSTRQNRKAN
ncbi:3-dehydroquinate synthase [Segniliparus rotundus DSM 44985]|uniref:2-epi-5-epi-valiolone synthase n=1 Tax=Segniliparus rotundus (strain ATCC BAA-972 / CDC 1076 / CIP 108378 / DSM 44985 / JCM 13578) TaxID=640132 RepID=D6ZBE0_SEGRD|nr:sedoheptulose 7-phosphate cyclase [Segniliparus rotundus]ADG98892.1 3-dehydroquinate synthase [Segniliparus rotundus DSM 44985]